MDPTGWGDEEDEGLILSDTDQAAFDKLDSIEKYQLKYRQGKDVSCIIDDISDTENIADYILSRITCLADLDEI